MRCINNPNMINIKNFTLTELKDIKPYEVSILKGEHLKDDSETLKLTNDMPLMIADAFEILYSGGSENHYLDITVYSTDRNNEDHAIIRLATKDAKNGLKKLFINIIARL